ncbi:hypothetical protein PROFUN_10166 [Planoprotostelium fungivorum]|uniref:Uncharacterized protein n=1 Tax=Planoprotostelium fungivorum TaxID=1890364 RepID=A0A2P6NEL3_9EUKA|nr:hypothetical protein PROFUN_10166 [Planoprotostelium fungivorum]
MLSMQQNHTNLSIVWQFSRKEDTSEICVGSVSGKMEEDMIAIIPIDVIKHILGFFGGGQLLPVAFSCSMLRDAINSTHPKIVSTHRLTFPTESVELIDWWTSNIRGPSRKAQEVRAAAARGQLSIVQHLCEVTERMVHAHRGHRFWLCIAIEAARFRHLDILKWAIQRGGQFKPGLGRWFRDRTQCSRVMAGAAAGGHLDIIKWLAGFETLDGVWIMPEIPAGQYTPPPRSSWSRERTWEIIGYAIKYRQQHILDWIVEDHVRIEQVAIAVYHFAVLKGHVDLMEWASSIHHYMPQSVCEDASRLGRVECYLWCREKGAFPASLEWSHMSIAKMEIDGGRPVDVPLMINSDRLDILKYAYSQNKLGTISGHWAVLAATHGKREIYLWLIDIGSLTDVAPQHVYQTALTFLNSLDERPNLEDYPSTLPRGMSQKVGLTSEVANLLKQNGYKGDISYHQILYPNPSEVRKLLMWLVDAMPKKAMNTEVKGGDTAIDDVIKRELGLLLKEAWTPHFASRNRKHAASTVSFHFRAYPITYAQRGRKLGQVEGLEDYYRDHLPLISLQAPYTKQIAPSLFEANLSASSELIESENEWNIKGPESGSANPIVYKKKKGDNINKTMKAIMRKEMVSLRDSGKLDGFGSQRKNREGAFLRRNKFTTEEEVNMNDVVKLSEEEMIKKREDELDDLRRQLSEVQVENSQLAASIKSLLASIRQNLERQVETAIHEEDSMTEGLEREYRIKKTTYGLLPEADKNIKKLQDICGATSGELLALAEKWETIRVPLYDEYRDLREQQANYKEEAKVKLTKIREMRAMMKELMEEINGKDEKYRELIEVYNNISSQVTRTTYTNRILDIVKNVKKQKMDIDKVLLDTRTIQKEINSVTATLNRTFSATEEAIFADAKKDPQAKELYKRVVDLNENFKKLIAQVEETGHVRNAILALESKQEQAMERMSSLNFERLKKDLEDVRVENQGLLTKLTQ